MTGRKGQLEIPIRTWGGRRKGAGRKASGVRSGVPHRCRAPHEPRHPAHVTLRACAALPSLRGERLYAAIRSAFSAASHGGFRLLQYSVQSNHVHLLVEADGRSKLARGVQGLAIRVAKAVNRALRRRGKVWSDRYHARALPTPREFRSGLVYVLQNWRKHVPGAHGFDPRSSARWFSGWRTPIPVMQGPAPVAEPRTWLARIGWRLHGLVDAREAPSRVL